jgi:hypothetical protein
MISNDNGDLYGGGDDHDIYNSEFDVGEDEKDNADGNDDDDDIYNGDFDG